MSDNKTEDQNKEFLINLESQEEGSENNTSISIRIPQKWKERINKLSKKNNITPTDLLRASILHTFYNFDNVKDFLANKKIESIKLHLHNLNVSNDDTNEVKRFTHEGLIINFTHYKITLNETNADLIFYNQDIEVCKYSYPIFDIKVK